MSSSRSVADDLAVSRAVTRMRAWAARHGEADTQGLMPNEWAELARAALEEQPVLGPQDVLSDAAQAVLVAWVDGKPETYGSVRMQALKAVLEAHDA